MSKQMEKKKVEKRVERLEKKHQLTENRDLATGIPNVGKWYVHKMRLSNGKSRFFISQLPKDETFELSRRYVYTPYQGVERGLATPVTLRFLNVIEDYDTKGLAPVYLVVACPAYVRADVSVQKMTKGVDQEEFEDIREVHELNAALRLMDIVDRERARAKNAEEEADMWKREFTVDRAAFGRKTVELWLEGDTGTAEDMMEQEPGFSFGKIIDYIKDNPIKSFSIIGLLVMFTKLIGLW